MTKKAKTAEETPEVRLVSVFFSALGIEGKASE